MTYSPRINLGLLRIQRVLQTHETLRACGGQLLLFSGLVKLLSFQVQSFAHTKL